MALYRYLTGKADLLAIMIEQAVDEPPDLERVRGGWRPKLEAHARSMWAVWDRHPWLPGATTGDRVTGPHEFAWTEAALGALAGTGDVRTVLDQVPRGALDDSGCDGPPAHEGVGVVENSSAGTRARLDSLDPSAPWVSGNRHTCSTRSSAGKSWTNESQGRSTPPRIRADLAERSRSGQTAGAPAWMGCKQRAQTGGGDPRMGRVVPSTTSRSLSRAASIEVPGAPAAPGFWRLNGINTFWFASQGMWNSIYVLLAISAALLAPSQKELVVGRATAVGGVFAVLVPIIAGALSDRTWGHWGRRTPWIVGGTAINLVGLVLLAWAPSVATLVAAYLVLQLGNNAAAAAFAGIIPDLVPEEKHGGASGLLNTASILGTIGCLGITLVMLSAFGSTALGVASSYAVIAALLAVTVVLSAVLLHERPAPRTEPVSWPRRAVLLEAIAPLRSHDFFWVVATRLFQTLGIWTILPFVTFYFQDVVRSVNFGAASDLWLLAVLAGGIAPAVACGYLSDRLQRRRLFVYASSATQALVAAVLVFTLVSSLPLIYGLGILFGVGYGAYAAVDWAMACDVLPERQRSAARDMALFHVAYTLPQVVGPALLAPVLLILNRSGASVLSVPTGGNLGYRIVFGSAAIWFVLATVMVRNVRGVR
jgi:MFS family permease